MKYNCIVPGLVFILAVFASAGPAATTVESGYYRTGELATNYPVRPYYFAAITGETVIVRVANEDALYPNVPDVVIYSPSNQPLAAISNKFTVQDLTLTITNIGWFTISCQLPVALANISNTLSFSVSMLRMPNEPLCQWDLNVGNIGNGESLPGALAVGADLDAAFFAVSNACRVIVRMGQVNVDLVPNLKLYDPFGNVVAVDFPLEYRSEITAFLTVPGRYTAVVNDYWNARGDYAVSLAQIPGAISAADPDFGTIINGEIRTGTIHHPGDLDLATFTAAAGDTNVLTMTKLDADLNPRLELYDPTGSNCLAAPVDPFQTAVSITHTCTVAGTYYLVCKDAEDRYGKQYTLAMTALGGPSAALVPPAPAGITASKGAYPDKVVLSWETVTNASGYDLWRSDGTNTAVYSWLVTNTANPYHQDQDATPNVGYYYKVKARNTYGAGPFSASELGYCGAAPDAPGNLAASDGTFSNYILVTWTAVTNASSYDLWRTSGSNSTDFLVLVTNHAAAYYRDSNVVQNLAYNYQAKARNICGLSAFSDSDTGYCGASTPSSNRYALLAGLDNYGTGLSPLDTCTNDVLGLRATMLLGDPSNRWLATNITTLLDAQATRSAIRDRLHTLAARSGAGDLVLYAHSSHGGYSGNLSNTFLCAYDANFTDTELAADLTLFRPDTRIIIILDACYSGGMFKGAGGGPPPAWNFAERVMAEYLRLQAVEFQPKGLAAPKDLGANIAFMTAANYDETCITYDTYSLYTGFLIRGCALPAVDDNGDGEYQFLELHNYASIHAVEINPYQHAQTYNPALLQTNIARAVDAGSGLSFDHHNDYDGDRVSDLAVYHEASGAWRLYSIPRGVLLLTNVVCGGPGYSPLTGDYDGDRRADLAVYRAAGGLWRISSPSRWRTLAWDVQWGGSGLATVVGDFNGDSFDDGALFGTADGFWYVITTFGRILVNGQSFTGAGFIAVPGDYNGDGIADYALYHEEQGCWFILSHAGAVIEWGRTWGAPDWQPVSGDFDGDGKSDLAVQNEASGEWYIWSLGRGRTIASGLQHGGPGQIPVPGDYNGDRKADLAVYNLNTGVWRLRTLAGDQSASFNFGAPGWQPARP